MKEIKTEIAINAPIEKIWAVLMDFSAYSTWNPFIRKIMGKAGINEKLAVTIEPPGKKAMTFYPKIVALSEFQFKWVGNLGWPGIFDGTHQFLLIKQTDNQTRLIHSEIFSGILHAPIFKLINHSTHAGFINMNNALKDRCEKLN